jgi:hypothetical protein
MISRLTRDAGRVLRDNDLMIAANAGPVLKGLLNTILRLRERECLD